MKKLLQFFSVFTLLSISVNLYAQIGTWTKVTTNAPHDNWGVCVLMTDGTVLCKCNDFSVGGNYLGQTWDRLTPDATGSYVNGTWTTTSKMASDRLFFSSQVLPSGKLYVAGGEYSY